MPTDEDDLIADLFAPDEPPHSAPQDDDTNPSDPDFDLDAEIEFEEYGEKVDNALGVESKPRPTKALTKDAVTYITTQRLLTAMQVQQLQPPRWFLHEVLPEAPLTVIHGTGGTKKSFLMLDLMLHADHGIDWFGRPIRPGRTLYIVGEGISGTGKRIKAWYDAHPDVDVADNRMQFLAHPLDLYAFGKKDDKGEFPSQVEHWRALIAALDVQYIVVDTLHRNAPGAEENSSLDMGKVFSAAQRIAGDAHLFFIHHDPKEGKTARGSSSIHDDADVVIRIQSTDPLRSELYSEKLRDAEDFRPITLQFTKDTINDSIVIASAEQWKPKKSKRQEILDAIRAEPGLLTQQDVCCAVVDGSTTRSTFKKLREEGVIFSEVGASRKKSGPKMVDYWRVDEDKADPLDEELDLSGDD